MGKVIDFKQDKIDVENEKIYDSKQLFEYGFSEYQGQLIFDDIVFDEKAGQVILNILKSKEKRNF